MWDNLDIFTTVKIEDFNNGPNLLSRFFLFY